MKKQSARVQPAGGILAKEKRRRSLINLIGVLLLLVAGVLVALLFFMKSPWLQDWYKLYNDQLQQLEEYVLDLPGLELISLAVLLLYAIKSVVPFFPISVMCIITGLVLPMTTSFAINIGGILILVSARYWLGRRRGDGQVQKMLKLHPTVRAFLEEDSKSRPWLLFVFRLVPNFPVNAVSHTYGAMRFDFADYAIISLLGFLPKLISYILLGNYTFDPLSIPFIVPLIIIFTLSGVSVIGVNMALGKREKGA